MFIINILALLMKNPQKQIVDLLKSLANRVVDLDSKLSDVQKFYDLIKEERYLEIVNNTPTFFRIHNNSIQRDLVIVLAKTFDPSSRRSIFKLIDWIKENKSNLKYKGQPITDENIESYLQKIKSVKHILNKIKTQRDKFIAHDDPIYFDEPYRINEDAPINLDEFNSVLKVLRKILFGIYSSLENVHNEMKLVGIRNIDFIVKLLRHQKILFDDDEIRKRMWNGDLPYPVDT